MFQLCPGFARGGSRSGGEEVVALAGRRSSASPGARARAHHSSRCASWARPSRAETSERLYLPPATTTSRVPSGRREMPWKRSCLDTAAASAASFTTSAPPSIVVMFLLGWKLKETRSPVAPTGLPPAREPMASAASSTMRTPWRARKAARASGIERRVEVHGQQHARARGHRRSGRVEVDVARGEVDVDEHRPGARALDHVGGGEEALRGRDDLVAGPDAEELQAPPPSRRWREVSVRTGRPPTYAESAFSKAATCGPLAIQRLRSVSATAAIMPSSIAGRANGR